MYPIQHFFIKCLEILKSWFGIPYFFSTINTLKSKPFKKHTIFFSKFVIYKSFFRINQHLNPDYIEKLKGFKVGIFFKEKLKFFFSLNNKIKQFIKNSCPEKISYSFKKLYKHGPFFPQKNCFELICKLKKNQKNLLINQLMIWDKIKRNPNFRKILPNLNQTTKIIRESVPKKRIDLRNLETFSIDPPRTIEVDDMLHYRFLKKGAVHEIGLHVPDIYTVLSDCQNSFMSAKERHKSRFHLNKKFNLFPKFFSKNYFSFNQFLDRLTFSTIFLFNFFGKVKKIKFIRSITKNKRLFSDINIFENIRKQKNLRSILKKRCFFSKKLILLENICFRLKSLRLKLRGDIDFLLKFKIVGRKKSRKFRLNLNEEIFILSNITIAEKILNYFPYCTQLRRINSLKIDDFSRLFHLSTLFSIKLNISELKKITTDFQILNNLKRTGFSKIKIELEFYKKLIQEEFLFFDSKKKTKINFNKIIWGPLYSQTSSPIRRFDDLTVQKFFFLKNIQTKPANQLLKR